MSGLLSASIVIRIWGFPKIRGTFLGGPCRKDYSILGSTLGSPYLGKLPYLLPEDAWVSDRTGCWD